MNHCIARLMFRILGNKLLSQIAQIYLSVHFCIMRVNVLTLLVHVSDGDEITIFDSSDVSFAIQTCNRQLKLVLYGKQLGFLQ